MRIYMYIRIHTYIHMSMPISTSTSVFISTFTLADINDKITNTIVPNDKEKSMLLNMINKQLTEEDHIYIFTEILQNMKKKIYTITENCTLFDLNDIDCADFWKIWYYTYLFISNQVRNTEINKIKEQNDELSAQFTRDALEKLKKFRENTSKNVPDMDEMSEYERLRIEALKDCQYSTYSSEKPDQQTSKIYSDNYQCKWKQSNKDEEIVRKFTNITKKAPDNIPTIIKDNVSFIDIVNEVNDMDDIIGSDESEDEEIRAIDEVINHNKIVELINKPKKRLLLKSNHQL